MSPRQYLAIRLVLWGIAVFIALLPTITGIDSIQDLEKGDSFRDLLFVVVPVSALALSTTFDYLCVGFPSFSASAFFNSLGSLIINGIGLATGLVGFVNIREGLLSNGTVWTYSILICLAVLASFITEIVASLNHQTLKSKLVA